MRRYHEDESIEESVQHLPAVAATTRNARQSVNTGQLPRDLPTEYGAPLRRPNVAAASLYASTLSPPVSRSASPAGRRSPFQTPPSSLLEATPTKALTEVVADNPGDPLNLMLRAFVPHVSVFGSPDTDELVADKGVKGGLCTLLRPYGERIQGKISIRDSAGVSKTFEDFSVRFTKFGDDDEYLSIGAAARSDVGSRKDHEGNLSSTNHDQAILDDVESVIEKHLSFAEDAARDMPHHVFPIKQGLDVENPSPYYALYLRRLLSSMDVAPHEAFKHPVACIIAISSRNLAPIETLRKLYADTSQGPHRLPDWVYGDYLRYYVLVHDEENDDIARSMGLFEQMKRHLGLHCHLLRLRSSQSVETDDEGTPLGRSEWMSAKEELVELDDSESGAEFDALGRYIFKSDATALRTFIREMVAQSIIPTMERHVSIWNEQVASRRRGITGRFMNLSRKWTGFSSNTRSSSGSASGGRDNYDSSGFYRADAPEAIMRKLADYAFMLRDWKLAHSIYDILRSDFGDAKVWKYHAAANEMAAVTFLMMPQQSSLRARQENVEQMLESAFYSYQTRCSSPYGALRSLVLGVELLRLRGGASIDDAGRWGLRLLESKILGKTGEALFQERLAVSYATRMGLGSINWGSRLRKSAAWSVLAAETWACQAKYIQSQRCLNGARDSYESLQHQHGIGHFTVASDWLMALQRELSGQLNSQGAHSDTEEQHDEASSIDEESEALTDLRSRRVSAAVQPGELQASLHGGLTNE